jgi:hypothetical protein
MNRIVGNSAQAVFSSTLEGRLRTRLYRSGVALMGALCLFILPTVANAACGSFGAGSKTLVKLPVIAQVANGFPNGFPSPFDSPTIVGLWHVIYTNGADQSTFNDTFDTWHSDGTEFESAYLAPAGGDVCVGVWKSMGFRSVKLHHIGWLFSPATPTASATSYFTLDEEVTIAQDNKSYSGKFTFKIWNLDGSATPVEVTGTMAAIRITVD